MFILYYLSSDPQPRKQSHEPVLESSGEMGLSRQSALNDRYFEKEKQRSRSLDNLLQPEVVQPSPSKLATLGLSSSKLNERYHSLERIGEVNAVTNVEYMSNSEVSQERKYSRITRTTEPNIVEEEDLTIDFEYPDIQSVSQTGRSEDDKNSYVRSQTRFIKSQYPGKNINRSFCNPVHRSVIIELVDIPIHKELNIVPTGKRALPGSQSSRAYIEKSEYGGKSSAMSDTSEAPSLASHVRRVRVPSQASDVDQFLDELFMPVLDGNLDEMSDARSLAASIKGTWHIPLESEAKDRKEAFDGFLMSAAGRLDRESLPTAAELSEKIKGAGSIDVPSPRRKKTSGTLSRTSRMSTKEGTSLNDFLESLTGDLDLGEPLTARDVSSKIKGGGNMDIPNQNTAFNFSPLSPGIMSPPMMMPMFSPQQQMPTGQNANLNMGSGFMPIPIYNMQGMNLPPYQNNNSPNQGNEMAAYQQNLQRAFLQSAMAQNMQIQQQLLAQNQALQQLLVQNPQNGGQGSGYSDGETTKSPVHSSTPTSSRQEVVTVKAQVHRSQSPPRKSLDLGRKISVEYSRKISIDRKPIERKSSTNVGELKRTSSGKANVATNFTNVLSELKNRKSSVDNNSTGAMINGKGVPPPPPMPPPLESHDPSESRPFLDPYGRAKTVRIGKWRWPPPSDSNEATTQDSFMEFKLRQHQQQRKITPQYQEYNQSNDPLNNEACLDWEEFEIENGAHEDRRDEVHASKHENGTSKDDGDKKKKKSK